MSEVLFNTSAPGLRSRLSELYSNAAGLDAKTADAFVKGWDMSLPVRLYEAGFREMLSLAKDGVPFDKAIQGKYAFLLSRSAQQSAYSAGKKLKFELGTEHTSERTTKKREVEDIPSVIRQFKLTNAVKNTTNDSSKKRKPYSKHRPSFRKGVVETVWNNAKGEDGLVRDPNTGEVIYWTTGQSRLGVWDMGHVPNAKYSEMHDLYMNGEITKKAFLDWYNDPSNYRPELPSNNRSHKYE